MNVGNVPLEHILRIGWAVIALMFLVDILLLYRKPKIGVVAFDLKTGFKDELLCNLPSLFAFTVSFAMVIFFQVRTSSSSFSTIDGLLFAWAVITMIFYLLVPKRTILADEGIFYAGNLVKWEKIRKVVQKDDMVILRRDRVMLLPPIKLLSGKEDIESIYRYSAGKAKLVLQEGPSNGPGSGGDENDHQ